MSMIYLIRHGQASFGHDDYDRLSPLGLRQSRILAQHLLSVGFIPDAVYAGTMSRQRGTAQEVISAYGAQGRTIPGLETLAGFDEYDTTAIVTAMFPAMAAEDPTLTDELQRMYSSKTSFKRVFETAMLRWVTGRFDTDGIEPWEGLKARVARDMQEIMDRHGAGRTIVVFTSGGAIAASLANVLGIPGEAAMRLNWQIVNTSMTRYMYNKERITLAGFNVISHLELAGDPALITYR